MSTPCQIYLHPAVAGNPAVIRQIHQATGLRAIVGNNRHAPTLTPSPASKPSSARKPSPTGGEVFDAFRLLFARLGAQNNPDPGPEGGDAA